jgi:hypothetical protein
MGHWYFVISTNYFTQWPKAYKIRNGVASKVGELLVSNVFCRFGVLIELHRDHQVRNFKRRLLYQVLVHLVICKVEWKELHLPCDLLFGSPSKEQPWWNGCLISIVMPVKTWRRAVAGLESVVIAQPTVRDCRKQWFYLPTWTRESHLSCSLSQKALIRRSPG